jgi:hypothetical protein
MVSTSALATSPGSYPGKASLEKIFPKDYANQSPALFPREQLQPLSAIYLIHAGAAGFSDIIRSADAIVASRWTRLGEVS